MKTLETLIILLLVAFIFAVIVVGALLGVLGYINEQRRPHCGNCSAWDRDLRVCWWDCHKCGKYDKGCPHHERDEREIEPEEDGE